MICFIFYKYVNYLQISRQYIEVYQLFHQFNFCFEFFPSHAPSVWPVCFLILLHSCFWIFLCSYHFHVTIARIAFVTPLLISLLWDPVSYLVYALILVVHSIQYLMRRSAWALQCLRACVEEMSLFSFHTSRFGWLLETIFPSEFAKHFFFLLCPVLYLRSLRPFCSLFFSSLDDVPWCGVFVGNWTSTPWALSTCWLISFSFFPFRNSCYLDLGLSVLFVSFFLRRVSIIFTFCSTFWESSFILFPALSLIFTVVVIFLKAFPPFIVILFQQPLFFKWSIWEDEFYKNFSNLGILFPLRFFFLICVIRLHYLLTLGCLLAFKNEVLKNSLEMRCSLTALISW